MIQEERAANATKAGEGDTVGWCYGAGPQDIGDRFVSGQQWGHGTAQVPSHGGTFTAGLDATSTAQDRSPEPSNIEPVVPSYLVLR